ncbi:hypothetical protein [Pendulispora albinea]|uniref:Lipoprotein n=1 Tax=Pendulispora albinea TaxID=2741071 RepID=A0ABZ2LZ37_9BACT
MAAGCSSSSDPAPAPPRPIELRGTYDASGAGPIGSITFTRDKHYELMAPGCAHSGCAEKGSYALDEWQTVLTLSSSAGGARTMAFHVLRATEPEGSGGIVKANDLGLTDLSQTDGGSLVRPGQSLNNAQVQSATLDGQPVQLTTRNGTCLLASHRTGIPLGPDGQPITGGECGYYQKKQCDPMQPVRYYRNDLLRFFSDTASCVACGGTLTGAAIVAAGGTVGSDGLLTVPAGALATTMATAGCIGCWKAAEDAGIPQAIDCTLAPCQYSTEARQRECQMICQTAYAYVPQVGYACQCTNNPLEACCRLSCGEGAHITDQCRCERNAPATSGTR